MNAIKTSIFSIKRVLFGLFVFMLASAYANAVGLSTFRIYLDPDKRDATFRVYNKEVEPQDCTLKLAHHVFDEFGSMRSLPEDDIPQNSAKEWIRFSPKKFSLSAANSQTVRFTLRRKANAASAEYRSYLLVDCGAKPGSDLSSLITIKPKLVHHVPIIVRTGKLDAEIEFVDVTQESGVVTFSIKRIGDRSVFGDLSLVNAETGDVISELTGVSIYTESKKVVFNLATNGEALDKLKLRFKEHVAFGGELTIEKSLVAY